MDLIKDTVYKGINHALDPTRRLVIFSGTPFNKSDILIEAVESGAWEVNVYPVCEKFPCTETEFRGAWEDRFSYKYIKTQYDLAKETGHLNAFYQELMLQITSDDERLIKDSDIRWYKRFDLLENRNNFNFYITTDFATSAKQSADYSVISVWAYNNNRDWFWVDGICIKQTMDKNINDLFKLVAQYKPLEVGIEVTGQQGGFISWIQREMIARNCFFNFASSDKNRTSLGIRPTTDKLTRFSTVMPWFKAGKMFFPEELSESPVLQEFKEEIRLATYKGFKTHDDFIDTISQLAYLRVSEPSEEAVFVQKETSDDVYWTLEYDEESQTSSLDNYLA